MGKNEMENKLKSEDFFTYFIKKRNSLMGE
jgi:hypothetical protein